MQNRRVVVAVVVSYSVLVLVFLPVIVVTDVVTIVVVNIISSDMFEIKSQTSPSKIFCAVLSLDLYLSVALIWASNATDI